MQASIDAMMLAPIELIAGLVDGMMARRFGRIVTVTSRFVAEHPDRWRRLPGAVLNEMGRGLEPVGARDARKAA